ncbi:MAG: hypothetical protein V1867_08180 [Candidatus Falkowbacteria bacterium]
MLDNPFEDEGLTHHERKTKLKEIFDELQRRLSVKDLEAIKEMLTVAGLDAATVKGIVINPRKIELSRELDCLAEEWQNEQLRHPRIRYATPDKIYALKKSSEKLASEASQSDLCHPEYTRAANLDKQISFAILDYEE